MPTAVKAAWIATVPVFTHCPYLAVWNSANFLANASPCLPGKGWPPQLRLVKTSSRAHFSPSVKTGQGSKRFFLTGSPPVIASFPIAVLLLLHKLCDCNVNSIRLRPPWRGRRHASGHHTSTFLA